ncbi:hypothetical protein BGX33_001178 [Mortierella sp. NVP41]|nr:hypothetical protein BGX33_001178 [Mortierella sp. NVP41]
MFYTRRSVRPGVRYPIWSNKNKTASAASTPAQTPAQTPRVSLEESRPTGTDTVNSSTAKQMKHAQDAEALHALMSKAVFVGHSGPYIL